MELEKKAVTVRPFYKKLLIAAVVLYVVGSMMIQIDLYNRLGDIEHHLVHLSGGHPHH